MEILIDKNSLKTGYKSNFIYDAEYNFLIKKGMTSEFHTPIFRTYCEDSDYDISNYVKNKKNNIISITIKLIKKVGEK